jgi:phosphatidate cytidylyltransferase
MRHDNRGSTLQRLLTALVLIPLLLAFIWIPALEPLFVLCIAGLAFLGLREYYAMATACSLHVQGATGTVAGTAVVLSTFWMSPALVNVTLFVGILAVIAAHVLFGGHRLPGLAASIFGVIYVGWFPAHFTLTHSVSADGPGLVMLLAVAVVLCDTGAYFAGRAFGRHKLAPALSPNKTWEGAIGGVLGAMAGMVGMFLLRHQFGWLGYPGWALEKYLAAGVVLAVTSQIGDLMESMIKRDAGVKDSGTIFPGHGGVLDRCDGFLLAAPTLYYLLML